MNYENLPTKRNLLHAKRSLHLANYGYNLLEKKQKILMRELTDIKKKISKLKILVSQSLLHGNTLLEKENKENVKRISGKMPLIKSLQIAYKNIMGARIPKIIFEKFNYSAPPYSLGESTSNIDHTLIAWQKVAMLLIKLSEAEIAKNNMLLLLQKVSKRCSALKNITIPTYEIRIKHITSQLEERERDELARNKLFH